MSDFLTHAPYDPDATTDVHDLQLSNEVDEDAIKAFFEEWNVDRTIERGGLPQHQAQEQEEKNALRTVYLLQRKGGKWGGSRWDMCSYSTNTL